MKEGLEERGGRKSEGKEGEVRGNRVRGVACLSTNEDTVRGADDYVQRALT